MKTLVYRHYKTKHLYRVIDIATYTEEDGGTLVLYTRLNPDPAKHDEARIWARPYAIFHSYIEVDGKKMKRFQRVTDDNEILAYLLIVQLE